jgi:hypothetical protein
MEVLECKNCGEMSVTDMIFGRWELPVADKIFTLLKKRMLYFSFNTNFT